MTLSIVQPAFIENFTVFVDIHQTFQSCWGGVDGLSERLAMMLPPEQQQGLALTWASP